MSILILNWGKSVLYRLSGYSENSEKQQMIKTPVRLRQVDDFCSMSLVTSLLLLNFKHAVLQLILKHGNSSHVDD